MRIDLTPKSGYDYPNKGIDARHWSKILKNLREESALEDWHYEKFYKWLEETWKIKVILANELYPGGISAIEVDDANYTMLLLRFPR